MGYKKRFDGGTVVVTSGVDKLMRESQAFLNFVKISLGKHLNGNWGEVDKEDKERNDFALNTATDRMMSVYIFHKSMPDERKIWIITEWDRSRTIILFPEEY